MQCDLGHIIIMDRNYIAITFFQNTVILRRPGIANFAYIIRIAITLVIKTFDNSKKSN